MSKPTTQRTGGILEAHTSRLNAAVRLFDAVVVIATYWTASFLYDRETWESQNLIAALVAIVAFNVAAAANGVYRSWRGAAARQETLRIFTAWAAAVATLLFLAFALKMTADFSRVASTIWAIATPVLISLLRIVLRRVMKELRARGFNTRSVAIAGSTESGERVARAIASDATLGLSIRGVYDDRNRRRAIPESVAPTVGTLDQLVEDARAGAVDIVYITLPLRAEHRIAALVTRLADTTATVYIVPEFSAYDLLHARWSSLGDQPVVSIFDTPFNGVGGWLKRVEDLVIGSMILGLIALPMLLVAIAIKLDSKGPVFFSQRRYGLNGKPIFVWKFRSMTVCEDGPNVPQAKQNDTRITRLGAFLRRSSIDELPQFFNVIGGSMSIVGPRPHAVAHNEIYRAKIKGYMLRHKVKPGITGWAQVNGWRGETDTMDKMERRIEHDLYYIHNWRLDWDLRIIFLTVFGRAVRKNAY